MNCKDAIERLKTAKGAERLRLAGAIAESLRFKAGLSYSQTVDLLEDHGIAPEEWEELMEQVDRWEGAA